MASILLALARLRLNLFSSAVFTNALSAFSTLSSAPFIFGSIFCNNCSSKASSLDTPNTAASFT
ncbi:hypothetical protein [Nostoc sp. CENA543]|uniref:hypothetical protein n=1 Tax=Nostoc sp. CENA543 TaxID=1869241 RepID=UPI001CEF65CB|nr:hypothetical protein [Nostoc sp. CENA543]